MASNCDIETPIRDVVIFYSEADEQEVKAFKNEIDQKLNDARVPEKLSMNFQPDLMDPGERELKKVGEICDISVQRWFYVTERWKDDVNMQLHKDVSITASLTEKHKFIPIWSKKKEQLEDILNQTHMYAVSAFQGYYAKDDNIVNKLKKFVFESEDHQKKKEELQKKWLEKQKVQMEQLSGAMSRATVSDPEDPEDPEEWKSLR